jgi:thiaminase
MGFEFRMTRKPSNFLQNLRQQLSKENERILNHEFVKDAEDGKLSVEKVKLFVTQQYYTVNHDLRSLATMISRGSNDDEVDYFRMLLDGDREALKKLILISTELGLSQVELDSAVILAGAASYTHYLAWLANYANTGEQVAALTVNLPVWGSNCRRLRKALKDKYSLKETGFFELFSGPTEAIEAPALKIMDSYLDKHSSGMERCARLIQAYELSFWDTVYQGA